jgi:hypothetical protein
MLAVNAERLVANAACLEKQWLFESATQQEFATSC